MDIEINGFISIVQRLTDEQVLEFEQLNNNLSQILTDDIDRVNEIIENNPNVFFELVNVNDPNDLFSGLNSVFRLSESFNPGSKILFVNDGNVDERLTYELLALCVLYVNEYFFKERGIEIWGNLDHYGEDRFDINRLYIDYNGNIETQSYNCSYLWSESRNELEEL